MTSTPPAWALRRSWDLDAVLPESLVTPEGAGPFAPEEHEARVFQDLVAEYDARLLETELLRRDSTLSGPFSEFLAAWAADEAKHTDALQRLYRGAFGVDRAALDERLAPREGDFAPLEPYLDDEFKLGVMLAYDEAMSAHGYGEDVPFYRSLGRDDGQRAAFAALLEELRLDEARHCKNAVELLVQNHAGRGHEVAGVMAEIVAHDAAQKEYRATFLLDHASEQFDEETMRKIGTTIVRTLERRLG